MTITATIIADSVSEPGVRLTTMLLRYHRYIHAEFMTHRMFSRNASSSRAIPIERLIADIEKDPAEPIEWGQNQKGMQAHNQVPEEVANTAKALWREDREHSIVMARCMASSGVHKQLVNRLIENHGHINVLVTATEWENFFHLRAHPDAMPEIRMLAQKMKEAMDASVPRLVPHGFWHLPFVTLKEKKQLTPPTNILISLARCARTSYMTHDLKPPELEADLELARKLVAGDPKHASPAEHQATPMQTRFSFIKNLRGWRMHRDFIPGENHPQPHYEGSKAL